MELDWNTTGFFNVSEQNASEVPSTTRRSGTGIPQWYESGKIQIPLYAVIFMLAVVGNTLVILTLVSNWWRFTLRCANTINNELAKIFVATRKKRQSRRKWLMFFVALTKVAEASLSFWKEQGCMASSCC